MQAPGFRLYLWTHRALYLGRSPDNDLHRHHAAQICLSLDQPIGCRPSSAASWTTAQGIHIPPDHPHQIEAGDARLLVLYVEPESDEYATLLSKFDPSTTGQIHFFEPGSGALESLRQLCDYGADPDAAWAVCAEALGLDMAAPIPVRRDRRVQSVIDAIRDQPDRTHSAARLGQTVHLSASRLSHLFREHTGVAMRRYVVWSRLRAVVALALAGESLTDAAHAAGFADAAHMSNAFRQMFGFAPSLLFAHKPPKDAVVVIQREKGT